MSHRRLVVEHIQPPIPCRDFDWFVYDENESEKPTVVGWGSTEWEAIRDYAEGRRDLIEEYNKRVLAARVPSDEG